MTISAQAVQRRDALERRRKLRVDQRAVRSQMIASAFLGSRYFYTANKLACFLSTDDEVDTSAIFNRAWRAGKHIFAPVVVGEGQMKFVRVTRNSCLKKSAYGLWEPTAGTEISPTKLDVAVTPIVAFDSRRHRIGFGGGYYDRSFDYLSRRQSWHRPKLVGLAFECQEVEKITANPWDIRLSRIITECRWR